MRSLLVIVCLAWPWMAAAQPVTVTGTISSQSGYVCMPMGDNASARVSIAGTFTAWYMATGYADEACSQGGKLLKLVNGYNGRLKTVSNTVDAFQLNQLGGVRSVQVQIYSTTAAGYGYTSGTLNVVLSATPGDGPVMVPFGAHDMGLGTFATTGSVMLSTRPACSYPASPCSPPAVGAVNAVNRLTLYTEISQVVCVYRILITASEAPWVGRVTVVDGSDGVALDFGVVTIDPNGPAWERFGSPLTCGDGGNNLMIETSAWLGAKTTIYAVAGR